MAQISMKTANTVRQALAAARHELSAHHGLVATDRPDEWDRALAWPLDCAPTLALLDEAIRLLSDSDSDP